MQRKITCCSDGHRTPLLGNLHFACAFWSSQILVLMKGRQRAGSSTGWIQRGAFLRGAPLTKKGARGAVRTAWPLEIVGGEVFKAEMSAAAQVQVGL